MSRYVVDSSVVLHLLSEGAELGDAHQILAPTLIRSEVLEKLYRSVRSGALSERVALDRLARFATMKIRYLGDKVLRRQAWKVAEQLGLEATARAEYIALTQLQADALVTLDAEFASRAKGTVPVANIEVLYAVRED